MLTKFGINSPQSGECRSQKAFFKHALGAATVHSHSVPAECLEILNILERTPQGVPIPSPSVPSCNKTTPSYSLYR